MNYCYFAGLDLGQSNDYTALTIVEQQLWISTELNEAHFANNWQPGWMSPEPLTPHQASRALHDTSPLPAKPPLHVRWLERLPLGTPYPHIVKHVAGIVTRPLFVQRGIVILVDKTGVGAPVVDMFTEAGLKVVAVTITGGERVHRDRGGFTVPKRDLVGAAQSAFQTRRLMIPDSLPDAEAAKKELQDFRVKINIRTAHDSYEAWREGTHDDLVLSLAMPVWYRDRYNKHVDYARLNPPEPPIQLDDPYARQHDGWRRLR